MFRRKPTFAFFLAVLFALGAPMLAATNPWLAESKGLSILKAELPPCTLTSPAQNRSFTVRDCTTKISCASTGTETVRLVCDGTTWRAINATATAVDLGDYAPLAGATFTGAIRTATLIERKATNVTVADDGAGTKPAIAIPITTDFATCTCNDATGCAGSIAEPTPTAGYGRLLTIYSIGSGNCEIPASAGVIEGGPCVMEPTSTATYGYVNSAWHLLHCQDNVAE